MWWLRDSRWSLPRNFQAGAGMTDLCGDNGDWDRVVKLWILRTEGVAISRLNAQRDSSYRMMVQVGSAVK